MKENKFNVHRAN